MAKPIYNVEMTPYRIPGGTVTIVRVRGYVPPRIIERFLTGWIRSLPPTLSSQRRYVNARRVD